MLKFLIREVLFCALVLTSGASLYAQQCNGNDSGAPCFTNNPDILNGRTALLPAQDIVFGGVFGGNNPSIVGTVYLSPDPGKGGAFNSGLNGLMPSSNAIEVSGQMFTQTAPQVVSAISQASWAGNAVLENSKQAIPEMQILEGSSQIYGTGGDFLGNGVSQMVFIGLRLDPPTQKIAFQALAAKDPNNFASGFQVGSMSSGVANASKIYAVTSGVFTDRLDGQSKPLAQLAVVSGNPSTGNGLTLSLYAMAPNLGFTTGKSINLILPEGNIALQTVSIAAGRFAGSGHDQVVVAYAGPANNTAKLIMVDFDPQGNPAQKTLLDTKVQMLPYGGSNYGGSVWLAKERFDWFDETEQAALAIATGGSQNGSLLEIVSFDQNLNATPGPAIGTQQGLSCQFGISAGRFFNDSNPPGPVTLFPVLLQNLASDCSSNSGDVFSMSYQISGAKPNFTIKFNGGAQFVDPFKNPTAPAFSSVIPTALAVAIGVGDLQGRSLLLGPAEKATVVNHTQPDTVIGVPPMHVDWITPAGANAPSVLNVSVFPATFNAGYSFQSGENNTVTQSATTSYTASTKTTADEKASYGIPGIAQVSVEAKQAATDIHKNTVSKKFNTYSGQTSSFSTKTIFDDVVAATTSNMHIYSYRVIGQCAQAQNAQPSEGCPAGTQPVYIQFSGPDNITYTQGAEGRSLEWYQPVHEPGNLFSYPANVGQLEEDLAGGTTFEPLTPTNKLWDSQTSTSVAENWTSGSGSSVSSGSTTTHTFDASISMSGQVSFDGFGAGASAGFDYNTSTSSSTLNQSTSTMSNSSGITLNTGVGGGPISDAVYAYAGQSFIYGQNAPEGTIQNDLNPGTTVQAQGFIAVGHAVDALSQSIITSGNFWPQAYSTAPDIALNHPQRWAQKEPSGVNPQQVQFNCPIGYTSSLSSPSCTSSPQQPTPRNVADAVFYEMKGLFATPGNTLDGPQITSTTLGSKVNLKARVYNYSLVNLPAGAILHVQFYAQPWVAGQFASDPNDPNRFAEAIFIGEGKDASNSPLAPVPAYCGGVIGGNDPCVNSTVRNWEYAYATWDTGKNGVKAGTYWKFWIVTWVELNGKLLAEIPGHGLIRYPQRRSVRSLMSLLSRIPTISVITTRSLACLPHPASDRQISRRSSHFSSCPTSGFAMMARLYEIRHLLSLRSFARQATRSDRQRPITTMAIRIQTACSSTCRRSITFLQEADSSTQPGLLPKPAVLIGSMFAQFLQMEPFGRLQR